jgi:tetratricopeptide (TPR) repeat protein
MGNWDEAEDGYRWVFKFNSDDPVVVNDLAWFLIDTCRNIDEGLELVNKALEKRHFEYYLWDTKGWGLYKQGKYAEALKSLEISAEYFNAYIENTCKIHLEVSHNKQAIHDKMAFHLQEILLHIQEVKRAIKE